MTSPKTPKFHRQRFLLLLLQQAGGSLSKMDFQKLLFLSQQTPEFSYYDFVPYHYGCYSFQAQSDMELLEKFGWVSIGKSDINLLVQPSGWLNQTEYSVLKRFLEGLKGLRGRKLVSHVYEQYPYYAIRSRIAEDVLDKKASRMVSDAGKELRSEETRLFTIGYEGISFEGYINRLIKNDIRLLCDVRKNPLSRKFGFSKSNLSTLLPKLGIEYQHIPDLGIESEKRTELNTAADYIQLFEEYRETLPNKKDSLNRLEEMLSNHKRIALTCFEKEHESCHRHCVSDYLERERGFGVSHL